MEIYGYQGREGASGREASSVVLDPVVMLFQKLPTREESFPTTGNNVVVRFSFLEEANNAVLRQ